GLDYALLAAGFTALVDALPVLGTGTVLFPWALGCLLMGDPGQALALMVLYAVGLAVHTLLEPRLLAGQVDLPPITALLAMYLGFHLMGVGGMLLLPVLLLLLKQFQDAGVVRLWR
ncbi:MAG: AI-2E family transporter, partial [Oscillospiraceae bacterium]|nr:AI-2E family transporter [Oscillospiraceae bacterium]